MLHTFLQGKLRVTIQGETIEQQFGEREVCFRTLDLYTSAVLEACLDPPSMSKHEWREMMHQLSETSCKVMSVLCCKVLVKYSWGVLHPYNPLLVVGSANALSWSNLGGALETPKVSKKVERSHDNDCHCILEKISLHPTA